MRKASEERTGAMLAKALRERRGEIEEAILTRAYSVSEPPSRGGSEYADGLRAAVRAGVEFGLAGIERGEGMAMPIPEALLVQARLAARSGVSLDTVLRRYFAGHTLIEDFMVEEAEREELLDPAELKRLLRSQASIVDRLLAAVSETYTEEAARRPQSTEQRKADRVEGLLAGEPLETADLGYGFEGWHLGLIASGPGAGEAIASVVRPLDARLLSVRREEGMQWAWLGSKQRLDPVELERLAIHALPDDLTIACGEPGEGIAGWRLSHRQARAALSVALRGEERFVRYSGVALLACALQDELLKTTLRDLYLAPLEAGRDGGATLLETLRAYLAANCNVSSTAKSMDVDRKTVSTRLRTTERRLGRPIATCAAELETALHLAHLLPASSPEWGIAQP